MAYILAFSSWYSCFNYRIAFVEIFHQSVSPLGLVVHIVANFGFWIHRDIYFWLMEKKNFSHSNEIRTHNNLVCKRTPNHLAKWLGVHLQTKWLWVQILLLSLNFRYCACFEEGVL